MANTMTAKGVNGTVVFDGRSVTFQRSGFAARATVGKGEKRVPVTAITAIQWRPASRLSRGYLQLTIPGGNEMRSRPGKAGVDAAKDENAVLFSRTQEPDFARLREALEAAVYT